MTRHDPSPEETSQVAGVFGGVESVADDEIFPRIVVEIDKAEAQAQRPIVTPDSTLTSEKVPSPLF